MDLFIGLGSRWELCLVEAPEGQVPIIEAVDKLIALGKKK